MPKQSAIPVVICEYHHEVLQYIHRSIASKKLSYANLKMVHLDSHPDLGFPKHLLAQDCYNKEVMYNNLEIADWILPLMYCGHLEKLIWLKPPWAEQIPNCTTFFVVGEDKDTKGLRVTCNEEYFLEDGLYTCSNQLNNSQNVVLQVCQTSDLINEIDEKEKLNEFTNAQSKKIKLDKACTYIRPIDGEKYILDIDLDYFSVTNPFLKDYTKEEYSRLRQIYNVSIPKDRSSEKHLSSFVKETQKKYQELENIIKAFAEDSHIEETNENKEMLIFLKKLKDRKCGEKIDWELVHAAGLTTELPHHISSEEKIFDLIQEMSLLLQKLPAPSLITIARSAEDEYCPPNQVDMIERCVLKVLQDKYTNIEVTYDYKDLTRLF
ncbi:UPF0489 protein C5orf22 homolog isoform X1 [Hydra vulgaris]|uniref:UPF0489 protein C5orf22 homolog isoform X1 n=1 Tax=Hydra vulgaris TaxID=6087 RepID=A0ABM4DPW5_HYDVU